MPKPGRAGFLALCLAGLLANAVTLGPSLKFTAIGVTDYMDLYAGGKLAFSTDLYVPARVLETEARTEGWSSPTRLFMRLPCFALLFWPLAQLPYQTSSVIWEVLCLAGIAAFIAIWPRTQRRYAALAGCWSLPLWMTVAEGQDIGFLLLWIALAIHLNRRRHPVLAGLVASLCLAKFQLFLLIPVWICARRQWAFAKGLLAGCATLTAISFATNGWTWPTRYLALLREPANNPYHEVMPNAQSMLEALPHAGALALITAIALAIIVWLTGSAGIRCSRLSLANLSLAAALTASLLIAPHDYMADCALLIPAALLLLPRRGRAITAQHALPLYLLTPIPWVLLMLGNGATTRFALCAFSVSLLWQSRRNVHPGLSACRAQPLAA